MLTKNAVGNLINRYRAVLDNCRLLNAFGALALATVLTANPAHATPAPDPITQYNDGTYSIDTGSEGKATFTVNGQAYYVLQKDQPITKTSNTAPLFIGNESTLNGGAISVATDGALGDITSYVFITNTALSEGGAVYTHGDLGDISSSTFIGNLADRGGALYNAWTTGDISSSTFIGNSAGRGGAIFNDGPLGTITDSTFTGNAAVYGGALYNNNTIPSIENSTFEGNSGRYDGGAIYNNDTITSITNSTFKGNKASTDGGAIWNRGTITSISNSTFENNESETNGGAIYNDGTITSISNSTFENNESETNGGAIYSTKPLNITNCSFWDNNAGDTYGGGAIYSEDSVTIIADGGVSEFSRNTGDGSDNGIHVEGAGIDFIMRNNGVFIMEDNVKADNITITSDGSGGSAFILLAPLNGDTTINNATIGIADDARFEKLIVNSGTNTVFSAAPPVPVALTAPSVPTPPTCPNRPIRLIRPIRPTLPQC